MGDRAAQHRPRGGTCGLHSFAASSAIAEIGCLLARDQWGSGIMAEALAALFAYARDALGVQRLLADIDAPNLRSICFFQKLGFVHTGETQYTRVLSDGVAG